MTGETRMLKSFRKLEVQEVSLNDCKILECSLLHTMASSSDPSDAATSSVADSRLRPETAISANAAGLQLLSLRDGVLGLPSNLLRFAVSTSEWEMSEP